MRLHSLPPYVYQYISSTLDAVTSFRDGTESTRNFAVKRGVRQGDPLSLLLCNFAMDELPDDLQGVPWTSTGMSPEGIRPLRLRMTLTYWAIWSIWYDHQPWEVHRPF
ncbi:hypothetical protein MTP99_015772 [Tenebrio molitor]|nr:hypothetical protein MTP99_015772 [Tenebrio molitor]